MKKTALLAAAAAMMVASPAAANGYLGVEYLNGESDVVLGNADSDGWQLEGAFGFGGTGWGAQIDGSYGNLDLDVGFDFDGWNLGGHVWWAGSGWRLGGLLAASNADGPGPLDLDETVYGVEGTFDAGSSMVFVSSLTVGDGDFAIFDYETWNWDVGGNLYASPNIRFGAFVGIGNVDLDGIGDSDSLSLGLNGEFQPWSAPVSITVGWNMYEIDDFDVEADMFHVGARWNIGGGTLRDRDNAAPFETRSGVIPRTLGFW